VTDVSFLLSPALSVRRPAIGSRAETPGGSRCLSSRLKGVTLSCPEPAELTGFYRRLTGGEVVFSSPNFVYLAADPVGMAFQRTENCAAPSWPDPSHLGQMHLDFNVAEPAQLDTIEAEVLVLGANSAEHQPRPHHWRVMLDPIGHPFCLSSMS
jgi:catechol 2,3-dioxygenase-like lactoylglutathione lyase family enzyme